MLSVKGVYSGSGGGGGANNTIWVTKQLQYFYTNIDKIVKIYYNEYPSYQVIGANSVLNAFNP